MLQSVSNYFKKNLETLSKNVPALKEAAEDYMGRVAAIYRLMIGQKNVVLISSGQKKSAKEGLAGALSVLSNMISAHHYDEGNKGREVDEGNSEKAYFEYTSKQLMKLPVKKLSTAGEQIIQAAKKVKRPQRYGVVDGDIKEAALYLEEFLKTKDKPTQSRTDTKSRNQAISRGIKECISLLEKQIDHLASLATRHDAKLANDYKAHRVILGKMFGRPSDKESRYRKSRKKKIDLHAVMKRLAKEYRQIRVTVTEAYVFGTYAKKQAYNNSKVDVALVIKGRKPADVGNHERITKKFPYLTVYLFSPEDFSRGDHPLVKQIRQTGVKVEL